MGNTLCSLRDPLELDDDPPPSSSLSSYDGLFGVSWLRLDETSGSGLDMGCTLRDLPDALSLVLLLITILADVIITVVVVLVHESAHHCSL